MANKKVSQLVAKPSVLVTDLFPIADPTTGQLFKTTISDLGTAIGSGVSSVNTLVGAVVLDTDDIQELASPTNRWFTDTRARAALSASSPLAYNSGTGVFSIAQANGSTNGFLSSADWTTFNAKQPALSGTGFVKISGTTISYDNSTYALDSAVVKLAGAQTITGLKTFSGGLIANVSTGGDQGFASTNTSTSATSVFVQNNSTGIGILANNALGGDAILIGNDTSGRGIYITNATISGGGKGISIDNYNSGIGIEVGSDSSADAIKVLHLAGRAFNIQSSGGGYGVIINNTTAATSAPFTIQKQGASVITLTDAGAGTFNSSLTASSFVKTSGTSAQFLKADGSVDSSVYALDSAVVKLTGNQTVAGIKTMSNVFKLDDTLQIKNIAQLSNNTGYTGVWAETSAIGFYTGANAIRLLYAGNYNYTMPSADGTLALTSQLSAYLPLSGGTLTGALSGTTATFTHSSGDTIVLSKGSGPSIQFAKTSATAQSWALAGEGAAFKLYDYTASTVPFQIAASTGAATFSSSVTATSLALNGATLTKPLSVFASDSTGNIRLTRAGTSEYMNISTFGLTVVGNDLQLQSGTSNTLQLNPNGGNVGIGTTSPNTRLHTTGSFTVDDIIYLQRSSSSLYLPIANYWNGSGNPLAGTKGDILAIGNAGGDGLVFVNSNTERMRITSSGNVGIGTTSPTGKLSLYDTSDLWINIARGSSFVNIGVDSTGTFYNTNSNHRWLYNSGSNEAMRITSAGNVGIGTTSPQTLLSIETSGTQNTISPIITSQSSGTTYTGLYSIRDGAGDQRGLLFQVYTANVGLNERMRITSSGKLLVNRTATIFSNSGHTIQGDVSSGGEPVLEVYNQSLSNSSPAIACFKNSITTNSDARFIQFYADAGTVAMGGIVGNGTSNVQFASISDIRKKQNINKLDNSLSKIMGLNPVSFNWKNNNEFVSAGFIAQEVEDIFPEYVVQNMLEENGVTYKGLTGGLTGGIIPILVKAIQELKAELDALKA